MKIDAHKLKDETVNPMAASFTYPDCPMPEKRPCFFMAVGGAVMEICPHFKEIPDNENEADCTFEKEG